MRSILYEKSARCYYSRTDINSIDIRIMDTMSPFLIYIRERTRKMERVREKD